MQQNPCVLERLRAENYGLPPSFPALLGQSINVSHAPCLVGLAVHIDMADNGIRKQSAVSRFHRILHGSERAAEVRKRAAAALAGAAIVAGGASVVSLSENRGASDGESTAKFCFCAFPHAHFAASHRHGRKELPVR